MHTNKNYHLTANHLLKAIEGLQASYLALTLPHTMGGFPCDGKRTSSEQCIQCANAIAIKAAITALEEQLEDQHIVLFNTLFEGRVCAECCQWFESEHLIVDELRDPEDDTRCEYCENYVKEEVEKCCSGNSCVCGGYSFSRAALEVF